MLLRRRMSPALNGSSEIRRFEHAYAIEIRDGIMFVFYLGLPHVLINFLNHSHQLKKFRSSIHILYNVIVSQVLIPNDKDSSPLSLTQSLIQLFSTQAASEWTFSVGMTWSNGECHHHGNPRGKTEHTCTCM